MSLTADETRLKKLLKAAVVEVLEERRDLVRDALAEAVEDMGMVKAIKAVPDRGGPAGQRFSKSCARVGEN